MTKIHGLLILAATVGGCAGPSTTPSAPATRPALSASAPLGQPEPVEVDVLVDGSLFSQGMRLADADLPAFKSEFVGHRQIKLVPNGGPGFQRVLEAERRMRNAGITNVVLDGATGG